MNPTRATVLVAALALTGCTGPATVDTISPDAPREEKDQVFTTYVHDTYGETYGASEDDVAEIPRAALLLCSMLDDGMPSTGVFDTLGLDAAPKREQDAMLDIFYQGTKVYCPEHTDSVEWMAA